MANMSANHSVFIVPNRAQPDCWFEVLATIGRHGTVVDCREHGRDVLFTLQNTGKVHDLRAINKLDCGKTSVSIKAAPHTYAYPRDMAAILGNVAAEQPPASDAAPPNMLDHLNDHILCELFQSRALDLDDLCSIGSACVRFGEAAEPVFRSRHRKQLSVSDDWPFGRFVTVLRLFGQHCESISIENIGVTRVFADIALGMVAHHCRNIEYLRCASLAAIGAATARFKRRRANGAAEPQPFGRLKSLKLRSYPSAAHRPLPCMRLPSLLNVDLDLHSVAGSYGTRKFFAVQSHIKRMRLNFGRSRCPVKQILVPWSGVEELQLQGNPGLSNGGHHAFGQLKRLRVLKCVNMAEHNVRLIVDAVRAGNVPLERLEYEASMQPAVAAIAGQIGTLKCIDCSLTENRRQPNVPITASLARMAVGPSLEEIRVRLFGAVKFDCIRDMLTKAPGQLKAASCYVSCHWLGAEFLTHNRRTIATIDRMVKERGIKLQVELLADTQLRDEAKLQLQQFSDWLTVA